MAPRGAICLVMSVVRDVSSERLVGIERWRLSVRLELLAPSLLHLSSVDVPQCVTQRLQALEDRQRLTASAPRCWRSA